MTCVFSRRRIRNLPGYLAGIVLAFFVQPAPAQTFNDDFNDGNDAGWTRYDVLQPFGLGATYSFPDGNSYSIDAEMNYVAPQLGGGRAGSIVSSTTSGYDNFVPSREPQRPAWVKPTATCWSSTPRIMTFNCFALRVKRRTPKSLEPRTSRCRPTGSSASFIPVSARS
jgi:hypothetical protein